MTSAKAAAVFIVVGAVAPVVIQAQARGNSSPKLPSFEVATIKPVNGVHGSDLYFGPREVRLLGAPLEQRIRQAWDHPKPYEIRGAPAWLINERFQVVGKYPEGRGSKDLPLLLQSLLKERLKLQFHIESKEGQFYELVQARGDRQSQLRPADGCSPAEPKGGPFCGFKTSQTVSGGVVITTNHYRNLPIERLIADLRHRVERPVLDNTGLTGNFDFDLTYDLEPLSATSTTPSGVPPLFEALEKQLGLKLVSKRGPVPVLVIDHVERPAPN